MFFVIYGYITEGKPTWLRQVELWGLPFYQAAMPPGSGPAKWYRAFLWRQLYRRGVRRCIMEETWWAEAAEFGLLPVETTALRLAVLPRFLTGLSGKTAALYADHVNQNVVRTAYLLARQARYVTVDVPRGGEELRRELRRRYGLSGAGGSAAETVDFTAAVPGAIAMVGGEMSCQVEGELIPEQAAALLWEQGRIKKEDVLVETPPRNA